MWQSVAGQSSGFPATGTPCSASAPTSWCNVLVLTGLLRFVLQMPDAPGVRPHPARARADAVSQHRILRVPGLEPGAQDRPHRCLRVALGHQRPAYVRGHVRGDAADQARHQRSDSGLGGRPDLGVHPELRPDGRRLRRPIHPENHPAGRPAWLAGGHLDHLHLDARPRRWCFTPRSSESCASP